MLTHLYNELVEGKAFGGILEKDNDDVTKLRTHRGLLSCRIGGRVEFMAVYRKVCNCLFHSLLPASCGNVIQ